MNLDKLLLFSRKGKELLHKILDYLTGHNIYFIKIPSNILELHNVG